MERVSWSCGPRSAHPAPAPPIGNVEASLEGPGLRIPGEVAARSHSDYAESETTPQLAMSPRRAPSPTPLLRRTLMLAPVVLLSCALGRERGAPSASGSERRAAASSEGGAAETAVAARAGGGSASGVERQGAPRSEGGVLESGAPANASGATASLRRSASGIEREAPEAGASAGCGNGSAPDRHEAASQGGAGTGAASAGGASASGRRERAVGRLRVSFEAPPDYDDAPLLAWLERCAAAVALYYGEFPVPLARVSIDLFDGVGIHGGQARPTSPPSVVIRVGTRSSARQFQRNWSMTHELVHLAFPNVPTPHHWIEEGLATYVEPIARARLGWITEDDVWAEWLENMPLGVPRARGLDHDSSWAATYWGGALFCLLADVAIRERTTGQFGLEHALRAIVAAGGTLSERWPLTRALEAGDRATGTTALMDTYHALADHPRDLDLPALWQKLGVSARAGAVLYDDTAPSAALRRSIVAGRR